MAYKCFPLDEICFRLKRYLLPPLCARGRRKLYGLDCSPSPGEKPSRI
ncbi:MAG: hypothetical protein IPI63_10490 [Methanothrix sp.]|nr:hypothetical protein [Methanothrix sp.]MBK7387110.1 hypothetical protein [Methanothrix sp.]